MLQVMTASMRGLVETYADGGRGMNNPCEPWSVTTQLEMTVWQDESGG